MEKPEQAAEQLFGEALDLHGEERRAFLDRACAGQPTLRNRVEALLRVNEQLGGFLGDSPLRAATGSKASAPGRGSTRTGAAEPSVTPGTQLGPYRIEAPLGEGGMGQVFRATDTRLGRTVAIKICNPEFIERFEQERRSIAAINHPRVCTLRDAGPNYLVMELVEGETLAARLKRGPLPLRETLRFGAQIAEALAVAHARGIVHRDLKPANIMLTKAGVKVLDFGLAKSAVDPGLTVTGHVMGTPAYMAPERLEGKDSDARADIYALGLILAEMATGRRSRDPAGLPPGLERLVRRCVELDPEDRWQSARDLHWEIESLAETAATPSTASVAAAARKRSGYVLLPRVVGVAVLLAAILAAILAVLRYRERPGAPPLDRVNVLLPEKSRVLSLSIAPDGRQIAVVLVKDGRQQIWLRRLDSPEMKPLEGTDGAANPFWSPDSRSIAFFADARLKKIEAAGGPVQTLCNALGALGGTWNRSGDILIGALMGVEKVSPTDGAVAALPGHPHNLTEIWPSFLPDGRHYVATRGQTGIWLDSMDSGEARQILPDTTNAGVAEPPAGRRVGAILFSRAGTLMALPFDMTRLTATGDPYPVAPNVAPSTDFRWLAATSGQGVLAWVSGQSNDWQYVWRDRQGKRLGAIQGAGSMVSISRDGKRLVSDRAGNVWTIDVATGAATQLTFDRGILNPIWSPDGRYVAYLNTAAHGLVRKLANGAGPEEMLLPVKTLTIPKSWSPDGRTIAYDQVTSLGASLFALPVEGDRKPLAIANGPGNADQGQFSPDGHWVAYTSNESGLSEIYVVPFPLNPGGGKWMVSRGGGVQARWRRDSRELFYISPDWKMMAVDVGTGAAFRSGTPHALFDTDMVDTGIRTGPISWDIAPDGQRFLIISPNSAGTTSLNVTLNWRPSGQ